MFELMLAQAPYEPFEAAFEHVIGTDHSSLDPLQFHYFLESHPEILFVGELYVPPSIEIAKDNDSFKLLSRACFNTGDIVYQNQTLYFQEDQLLLGTLDGDFVLFDNVKHTTNQGGGIREFFYFDSFMNHSCDPNTLTHFISENSYLGIALRPIVIGEELTCDYGVFDTQPDGEGFQCECGAENCRGFVY